MWNAFKEATTEALGSKKFLYFMAAIIAAGAARLGWNVDQTTVDHYLELAGALILAQGVADHGKGAAEVAARAGRPPGVSVTVAPKPSVAPVVLLLAALGGAIGLAHTTACATVTKDAKTAGSAFIDCSKQDLGQMVGDMTLLATVATDLARGDYDALLTALESKVGGDALACAVLAVDTVTHPATGAASTVAETPVASHARATLAARGWKFAPSGSGK